ncbi:MAG: helix-turn-helix transcriptional regulator [Candidatus Cybelea sp.]
MKFSRMFIGAFLDALLAACGGNQGFQSLTSIVPRPNLGPTLQGLERSSGSSGFGTLLRHHRLAAGLSQEALAERARLSLNGISALERGYRRRPQRQTLALLTDALGLNGDEHAQFELAARSARLAS